MNTLSQLPIQNIIHKPGRSTALVLISTLLAFVIFGGSTLVSSLNRGLDSLSARLGADLIVIPNEARSKVSIESILLQGKPGYFYMDKSKLDLIASFPGIKEITSQVYLSTLTSSCCSLSVQLIGFDPNTDFLIKPWINEQFDHELKEGDVIVGSELIIPRDHKVKFYDQELTVVAQLQKTGTELDTAVYMDHNTIKRLIAASIQKGRNQYLVDPDKVVSSILIKVKDGYTVDDVTDYINIHAKRVKAIKTKNMISGIADSLEGFATTIKILTIVVWLLSLILLLISFSMIINERKKEFATLRVVGASRSMLAKIVLSEASLISLAGGIIGIFLATLAIFPFSHLIESKIQMPFLIIGFKEFALLAFFTILASILVGAFTSAFSAYKISRIDPGVILREGN